MGVKLLRTFLTRNCSPNAIKPVPLSTFAGKRIVIDTSIYLYKYKAAGLLLENMERLVKTLRSYQITPIFVLDPPPSKSKLATVSMRADNKQLASAEYNILRAELDTLLALPERNEEIDAEIKRITTRLAELHQYKTRVTDQERRKVRALFDKLRVYYVTPAREADMYCAYLVLTNRVWGVISNDTDMFIYGCNNVIMDLDIDTETGILHNMRAMLHDLRMTQSTFKDIMIISGTDYNVNTGASLPATMHLFYKYKNEFIANRTRAHFYDWLLENTTYIKDIAELKETYVMFDPINNVDANLFAELAKKLPYRAPSGSRT